MDGGIKLCNFYAQQKGETGIDNPMKNRYTKRTRAAGGVAVPCTSNPLELG